jgi:protein O-mannosyl-transferase
MTNERSIERSMRPTARSQRYRAAFVLAVVTAAVWTPSLRGGFVWDDQHDIVRSDRLHHLSAVVDVFRHHAMWSADQPETEIATYRPLALATIAVDWQLWHLRPAGYHVTNVLLHVLATLALFLALLRLIGYRRLPAGEDPAIDERAATVLALLFALHPANAEAVAWINGRSEMLALGLGALALWAAASERWPALAAALLLAMLSKETGALFAPVAVAVAWRAGGRRKAPVIAAALAVAAYTALRATALGRVALPSHAGATLHALLPVWARATVAALWPARLAPVELSTWLAALSPAARHAWTAGGLALVAALGLLVLRRRWLAAIGLGWWLAAVAPTAAVAALDYPWPGLARWLYVGLPGLALALYCAIAQLRPPRLALVAGVTALAALFVVGAERGIAVWSRDDLLYSTMVAESPDDAWAWRALGTTRLGAGRYGEAADAFHRAVATDRTAEVHAAYALEAYAWTFLGRCHDAIAQFRAHPITPALKSDDFEAAAANCVERTPPKGR